MKIAVMQPYFFPYIGYFQLINAVDIFVLYDDVNFIKNGWINRNKILNNDKSEYFTFPLINMSPFKKIYETSITTNTAVRKKMLRKIFYSYGKSKYFFSVFPIIERAVMEYGNNISYINYKSILDILSYINIDTKIILSSSIQYKKEDTPQKTLVNIIKYFSCDTYYNPIGGIELYQKHFFEKNGIILKFLNSVSKPYKQFTNEFVSHLSIIDVMMFNSIHNIQKMLGYYELQ